LTAPIIVSALFGDADFHWLDEQRRVYFPAERNQINAHLTLFHHLPPNCLDELKRRLKEETRAPAPDATLSGLTMMGFGVAYTVQSPQLLQARAAIADAFQTLLIPQDKAGWRPHVTIQNKVKPAEAKELHARLSMGFSPRPLVIAGLAAFYYRDGPWETIAAYRFGSGHPMKTPPSFLPRLTPKSRLL
jgi:2'-5' RNA ligase superfamily